MIDWQLVDTVLLDMDGTLLDLHFDNHFWLEHVPQRLAEAAGRPIDEMKEEIHAKYRDKLGTLEWYCVDHWSRELGLDIALLKEEVQHLIAVHPHVVDFLEALARAGKHCVLVTNAHQKTIALKMEKTSLGGHFDRIICSHEIGKPKEDKDFWVRMQAIMPFDPARALFVDDSLSVLRSAQDYGIGQIVAVTAPDSKQPAREVEEFNAIRDFSELMPGLKDQLA